MVILAAAIYFAQVFALGFALGVLRVSLLEPQLGAARAELIELPIMVACCAWLARRRVARTHDLTPRRQLAVGAFALLMLLTAECALGYTLEGRSPRAVLFDRDPLAGALYYVSVAAFAAWPWYFAQRRLANRQP